MEPKCPRVRCWIELRGVSGLDPATSRGLSSRPCFGPGGLIQGAFGPLVVAVAQLVRAPDCGSGGRGFKSPQPPFGWRWAGRAAPRELGRRSVAQLVEHRSPKPGVGGSIPSGPVRDRCWQKGRITSASSRGGRCLPDKALSSRGPGHSPLKAGTRVRIPLALCKNRGHGTA